MIRVFEPRLSLQNKLDVFLTLNKNQISGTSKPVSEFEETSKKYFDRDYGVALSNGSVALEVALKLLNLKENDEVIMPSFTIISCLAAVIRAGATPVFCDVDKESWNMSLSDIKKVKSKNNPLENIIGDLNNINWKSVYKGFKEFSIPVNDNDSVKLIKMDPGTSVPLHSHNGKEYILVLDGSFCDEYGEYNKGDMQINDQKIKHNPVACNKDGCICLSITENDVVFFGKFGSLLNLFTFIKSFFK